MPYIIVDCETLERMTLYTEDSGSASAAVERHQDDPEMPQRVCVIDTNSVWSIDKSDPSEPEPMSAPEPPTPAESEQDNESDPSTAWTVEMMQAFLDSQDPDWRTGPAFTGDPDNRDDLLALISSQG